MLQQKFHLYPICYKNRFFKSGKSKQKAKRLSQNKKNVVVKPVSLRPESKKINTFYNSPKIHASELTIKIYPGKFNSSETVSVV